MDMEMLSSRRLHGQSRPKAQGGTDGGAGAAPRQREVPPLFPCRLAVLLDAARLLQCSEGAVQACWLDAHARQDGQQVGVRAAASRQEGLGGVAAACGSWRRGRQRCAGCEGHGMEQCACCTGS